jgi:hypothetical protein|tara:strand:+ start:1288 stop:1476 length:189 start_codon:yes stop_codon:yes gene_type:complete
MLIMTDIVFNPYRIRFLNGEKLTSQEQDLAMMEGREYLDKDDELVNRVADKVIQKIKEDGLI